MSYHLDMTEPPLPAEGIWHCRRCWQDRVFVTLVEHAGHEAADAPLFCEECDWEMPMVTTTTIPPVGPPEVVRAPMPLADRRAGRARLQARMLAELGGSAPVDDVRPVDQDDLAMQIAMLRQKGQAA